MHRLRRLPLALLAAASLTGLPACSDSDAEKARGRTRSSRPGEKAKKKAAEAQRKVERDQEGRGRPVGSLAAMDAATALIVVDVQQAFDDADYWGQRNNPACEAQRRRADRGVARPGPPARVRAPRLRRGGLAAAALTSPATRSRPRGQRRARPAGDQAGQLVLLRRAGPRRVATASATSPRSRLCGITTNHCVETTARMGGNLGYDVLFRARRVRGPSTARAPTAGS